MNTQTKRLNLLHRSNRQIIVGGVSRPARELTPILGGILAVNSVEEKTVINHEKKYEGIDLGCAINEFSFAVRRDNNRNFMSIPWT